MLCFPSIVLHNGRCKDMLLAAMEQSLLIGKQPLSGANPWELAMGSLGVVDGLRRYTCNLQLERCRSGSSDVAC